MPAPVESPDAIPDLDADPLFQPDVVHAPQGHGGVAVEHDSPKLVDAAVEIPGEVAEGRGIALSKEHCLTHWPKSPFFVMLAIEPGCTARERVQFVSLRIVLTCRTLTPLVNNLRAITSSFLNQQKEKNILYSSSKIVSQISFQHILQFPAMLRKWLHLSSTLLVCVVVILQL